MARGGHRENSGRPSPWESSSDTKAIRVPAWMVDEILGLAKKLDKGESIGNVQNQKDSEISLERLQAVCDKWEKAIPPKQVAAPRWINTCKLLAEVAASLSELREGGEAP